MAVDFIFIAAFCLIFTVVVDLLMTRITLTGIDFLFYAPWAIALTSPANAIIFAIIITFVHAVIHSKIAPYILLAIPCQIISVIIATFLGPSSFFIALFAYLGLATLITLFARAIGGRFMAFLIINLAFNIIVYSLGLFL
ncbi:MAG: hypothetical protein HY513_03250 [Candidatus Aenigmarchaeota archaeon]|nr:hypothetical protein [Candidatus Aenigmarchaeota archaeon]